MLELQDRSTYSIDEAVGKSLGFAVHGEETKKALVRQSVIFTDNAKVVLHQVPAHAMRVVPNKINVLYTAFESENLPDAYVEEAIKADLIIGTSKFVSEAFKKRLPGKSVVTVPLGVDINLFDYVRREYKEPFLYLWVGAPDFRKGWDILRSAWKYFENRTDCGLIIKTTGRNKLEASKNVIVESRKLEVKDLVKIYHMAHCFIFPSYGEGFGLPLAEAMSTGLPCIYVPWSGVTEFANNKNAIPLNYKLVNIDYGVPARGAMASIEDLILKMNYVKNNYKFKEIKLIGKEARRTIERHFSWDDTARKIKLYIEEFIRNGTVKQR